MRFAGDWRAPGRDLLDCAAQIPAAPRGSAPEEPHMIHSRQPRKGLFPPDAARARARARPVARRRLQAERDDAGRAPRRRQGHGHRGGSRHAGHPRHAPRAHPHRRTPASAGGLAGLPGAAGADNTPLPPDKMPGGRRQGQRPADQEERSDRGRPDGADALRPDGAADRPLVPLLPPGAQRAGRHHPPPAGRQGAGDHRLRRRDPAGGRRPQGSLPQRGRLQGGAPEGRASPRRR